MYPQLRTAFESFAPVSASLEARNHGAAQFVASIKRDLGISVIPGRKPTIDPAAKLKADEFDLKGLAEGLLGPEAEHILKSALTPDRFALESEGSNAALTPGNFPNVSAYLGTVTGLLDAKVIEGYNTPEYIIDSLIATSPSKVRQRALIGIGRIGDKATRRNPGEGHSFAQPTERKIWTQETFNDALAMAVTFEAVFFDQTGDILERAQSIGMELALRKELDGFRLITGVNNYYNYNGVSYNTYLTSGNWVNKVTSNPLADWTALNAVKAMFSRMTDQEQGQRIGVTPDTLLVSPLRQTYAEMICGATGVQNRNTAQTVIYDAPAMYAKYRPVSSPILDQVLTSAAADGGLALAQSAADDYWWLMKTGQNGAFVRNENWGLTIERATPNDFIARNQRIVMAVFANQMHSFDIREPRYVILSTG